MKGKTFASRAWFLLLFSMAAWVSVFSQNPFELTPRLPKGGEPAADAAGVDAPQATDNPFDIVAPSKAAKPAQPAKDKDPGATPDSSAEARYGRFLFTMVIQIFLYLTILVTLFRSIPGKVYRAFLNDNMLSQLHREQGPVVSVPYLFFYLFFFLNAGFFLFLLAWHYDVALAEKHWVSYLSLTGGLLALFGGKHLVLKILEFALPVSKELKVYSFTIVIFSIFLGFLLVPINLLVAYGPAGIAQTTIFLALGLTGLAYAFRFLRGVLIAGRHVALHLFHFLLYICAVEIAPALIIAKALHTALTSQ
jgi:hypothetical protein